jgi:hypothetical protein
LEESTMANMSPSAMPLLGIAAILSVAGCNKTVESIVPTTIPTEQTVAGLPPDGTVSLTETFVGGVGGGKGVLSYHGKKYPFILVGSVVGPGSLSKIQAKGEVYKLNGISEFPGPYAQGTGAVGLETAGASDLWLENGGGVVMHLTGTQAGVTLSLGRDEILIKMTH